MRYKKQRWFPGRLSADPSVVEGGDHRLSSACRRDNQVTELALDFPFRGDNVEDLLLEWVRTDVKKSVRLGLRAGSSLVTDRVPETFRSITVVRLELLVMPIRLERSRNFIPQVRKFVMADFRGPFSPFGECRL